MRLDRRWHSWVAAAGLLLVGACAGDVTEKVPVPGTADARKSDPGTRAARRAYDGAPPTIAHEDFGIECTSCHNEESPFVEEGFVFDFDSQVELGMHEKYPLKYEH